MRFSALLLPVGPLCVGLLRFLLPYDTSDDNQAAASAVISHPGRESAVLWLGLVAVLTLVPGLFTLAAAIPPGRLKAWSMALSVPGYLCLGVLLAEDQLLYSGAAAGKGPDEIATLLAAMHPSMDVATAIFVVGHVVGTVLLGIGLLRSRLIPSWACWLTIVSQPLHFVAAVVVGSPVLDLMAWTMTAVGLAMVTRRLLSGPHPGPGHPSEDPGRSGSTEVSRVMPRS